MLIRLVGDTWQLLPCQAVKISPATSILFYNIYIHLGILLNIILEKLFLYSFSLYCLSPHLSHLSRILVLLILPILQRPLQSYLLNRAFSPTAPCADVHLSNKYPRVSFSTIRFLVIYFVWVSVSFDSTTHDSTCAFPTEHLT